MYGWKGKYTSWNQAVEASDGYDSDVILNKVRNSLIKVKNGEAVFERDGVLFDQVEYSFPLLTALLKAAGENNNKLSVLDFGGSIGSSYYQNKKMLGHLSELLWAVVEQDQFVEAGKKDFENEHLKFYHTIEEATAKKKPDIILLCSVIQYIENPYELLDKLMNIGARYILIDRTPMHDGQEDTITIQKVPPVVYKASYPSWVFSEQKLKNYINKKHQLLSTFESIEESTEEVKFKGFWFTTNKK